MANDPYEKYKKYQGGILGNNLTSGLLGNPNFLIGANIFGQGLKGQDPFSSIMPSVFQAAQIQKALTPKSNLSVTRWIVYTVYMECNYFLRTRPFSKTLFLMSSFSHNAKLKH